VNKFRGDFSFLSNFYPCKIEYKGLKFQSSEATFQSQKCPKVASIFVKLTASEAKKLGRNLVCRNDWDEVKLSIMEEILKIKFAEGSYLAEELIGTGNLYLIEGNTWGDTYWGMFKGIGQNMLGKLLMKIRKQLQQ